MYKVTLPSGKTYTFGPAKRAQAQALADKTGGTVVQTRPSTKRCVCGRPEDDHESYDCVRDWNRTGGW